MGPDRHSIFLAVLFAAWPIRPASSDEIAGRHEEETTSSSSSANFGTALYSTDFESFVAGGINGQDDWCTGAQGVVSGFPGMNNCVYSDDGSIVVESSGNQVLEIVGRSEWGFEVGRNLNAVPSKHYLRIEMNFAALDPNGFWFMDMVAPGSTDGDAIFWGTNLSHTWAYGNARPFSPALSAEIGTWHRIGIEIDQTRRQMVAVSIDGEWRPTDDSEGTANPILHERFFFRGLGEDVRLWLDNLSAAEADFSMLTFADPVFSCDFETGDDSDWSASVP